MKGIIAKKGELCLLVGRVQETKEVTADKFEVAVSYDEWNPESKKEEAVTTILVFQNTPENEEGRKATKWADIAKRMRMQKNSVVCTMVRFGDDTHKKANAYICRYNGVIALHPTENDENDKGRNCIGGMVTWMKDKLDCNCTAYISMGLYIGKDRDGKMQSVTVNVKNEKLMDRCKKALAPREDGTKMTVWFLCGEEYVYQDSNLEDHYIYPGIDFTITGKKAGKK